MPLSPASSENIDNLVVAARRSRRRLALMNIPIRLMAFILHEAEGYVRRMQVAFDQLQHKKVIANNKKEKKLQLLKGEMAKTDGAIEKCLEELNITNPNYSTPANMSTIATFEKRALVDLVIDRARSSNMTLHEQKILRNALTAVIMGEELAQLSEPMKMYTTCLFSDMTRQEAIYQCPEECKAECERLFATVGYRCFETIFREAPHWAAAPDKIFSEQMYHYGTSRQRTGYKPDGNGLKAPNTRRSERLASTQLHATEVPLPTSGDQLTDEFHKILSKRLRKGGLPIGSSEYVSKAIQGYANRTYRVPRFKHLDFLVDCLMAGKTKEQIFAIVSSEIASIERKNNRIETQKCQQWKMLRRILKRVSFEGLQIGKEWILTSSGNLVRNFTSYNSTSYTNGTVDTAEVEDHVANSIKTEDDNNVNEELTIITESEWLSSVDQSAKAVKHENENLFDVLSIRDTTSLNQPTSNPTRNDRGSMLNDIDRFNTASVPSLTISMGYLDTEDSVWD